MMHARFINTKQHKNALPWLALLSCLMTGGIRAQTNERQPERDALASNQPGRYGINVRDAGAVGDGKADDYQAIQQALDSGQPLITIPAGLYMVGHPLRVSSNTRIFAHPQAHIRLAAGAATDANSYLIGNRHQETGDQNISIEGGIWDGNNPGNPRGPASNPGGYHGVALCFKRVDRLTLRRLTVQDPETFHIRLNYVTHFDVEYIHFEDQHIRPNQDGIHLAGGCEDGVLAHISADGASAPNDDMIALNSSDTYATAGAVELIGETAGAIRRIRIEDIHAENAFAFVRLLSVTAPIEDVNISHVSGGCYYLAFQMQASPYLRRKQGRKALGGGEINHVKIQDVNVYRTVSQSHEPLIDIEQNVHDLVINNFQRDLEQDGVPEAETLALDNTLLNKVTLETPDKDSVVLTSESPQKPDVVFSKCANIRQAPSYRADLEISNSDHLSFRGEKLDLFQMN